MEQKGYSPIGAISKSLGSECAVWINPICEWFVYASKERHTPLPLCLYYLEHHSFKDFVLPFFMCCWHINFLDTQWRLRYNSFLAQKPLIVLCCLLKVLNITSLTNLIIMTPLFSSIPTSIIAKLGNFSEHAQAVSPLFGPHHPSVWNAHSLYLHLVKLHMDTISLLPGCLPAPGAWRTRVVLVISHRTLFATLL